MSLRFRSEVISEIKNVENIQTQKRTLTTEELVQALTNIVKSNFLGCNMVLTLFVAALNSYRSDKCLRPFPPNFIRSGLKDFCSLRRLCDSIPPLNELLAHPFDHPTEMLELLQWLLIDKAFPLLVSIPFEKNLLPCELSKTSLPDYVFEVHHCTKVNSTFGMKKGTKKLFLAFHGSHIDNFYSILKVGLQQCFSVEKETLFGKGIYLSSEYTVSSHYAPYGSIWKNSCLGTKHSVIAVCEIINDVEKVKCKDAEHANRCKNENSTGHIPDKYYVVTDSDMVRLKYLLVYKKNKEPVRSFLRKNIFWVILALYFIMLVMVGHHDSSWKRYLGNIVNA